MTKVVVDPNVWIAALISPAGTPAKVLAAVGSGRVVAVVSPHLLNELNDTLARPKFRRWLSLDDATTFIAAIKLDAELHQDPSQPARQVRDPHDDYLAALAESAGAVLVTGDNDLLAAKLSVDVITPRQLLDDLG